jgi:long-chain acyl-CoA synthetase
VSSSFSSSSGTVQGDDFAAARVRVEVQRRPPVSMSVIDAGPRDAETVILFVQGAGGHALQWVYQLRHFSAHYRCIAPDLRGHAGSDKPRIGYSVEGMADDLLAVLDGLAVRQPVVIVAHSAGGLLALSMAARHPDRLNKLVLINSAAQLPLSRWMRLGLRVPTLLMRAIRPILMRRGRFNAPPSIFKQVVEQGVARWDAWDLLPNITCPTLIIAGMRDWYVRPALCRRTANALPRARLEIIRAAGHQTPLERPAAVNRALDRFLESGLRSWRSGLDGLDRLAQKQPWLDRYDSGVPRDLAIPDRPLPHFLEEAAQRWPDRPALIYGGCHMSYARLAAQARRWSGVVRDLGVRKGDRLLILLPNVPQAVIGLYGALMAGAVAVLANPLSNERELARQLEDSGAETVLTLSRFYPDVVRPLQQAGQVRNVILTNAKTYLPWLQRLFFGWTRERREGHRLPPYEAEKVLWWEGLMRRAPGAVLPAAVSPDDLAVLLYTGGTSGSPKGVMLSHRNLVANALQTRAWVSGMRDGQERLLGVLPFAHSYGLTACLNTAMASAAALVLLPTFDAGAILEAIRRYHPTLFPAIPAIYAALVEFPGVRSYDIGSVKACISGASPLPVEVLEGFEKLTRGRLVEGFGLTEASPVTHANPLYGERRTGTIGLPLPGTDARIVGVRSGRELPPGTIGELVIRGPQVMQGYWRRPDETAAALRDGWLHTGDLAEMDGDGYFRIIDRVSDLIHVGRRIVFPRDVEEVLYEHPAVQEVAAIGAPGPQRQGEVRAYVVLTPGESATEEELLAFCRGRLRADQVPTRIRFRDTLPRSFIGRVLRHVLIEEELSLED